MDEKVQAALATDRLIDITTIGRKSGKPRRIEITFHNIDSRLYISGSPGRRDWYANLLENPKFEFHLIQSTLADLPARAEPITEESAKREILRPVVKKWGREDKLEIFVARSPLVEVFLSSAEEAGQGDPGLD